MDIRELKNQISEIVEENSKLSLIKNRYQEYAKQLREISGNLAEMANSIDPKFEFKERKSKTSFKEQIEEVYHKMLSGLEPTTELLEKTYNIENRQALYFIKVLRSKSKKIETIKDGKNIRLVMRN